MKFKTKPYRHQLKALKLSKGEVGFAYLLEQGTGKSWIVINEAAELFLEKQIDLVLIIAPKGVAPGWIRQQFAEHCPIPYVAAEWRAPSRMTKARARALEAVLRDQSGVLKVVVMNIEAYGSTSEALNFALGMLDNCAAAYVAVDESHRIKTPQAHTTKRILNLRRHAAYRRILTGTVADKPFDVFSQFAFLDPSILETESFTAFKSEYAEMEPETAGVMRHIAHRMPKMWKGRYIDELTGQPTGNSHDADGVPNRKMMEPKYLPQIVAKDAEGQPRYKNLDKLHALLAPHSYRVLKADCLDLPRKLYNRYYTELSDRQASLYREVRDAHRIEWEEERISTFSKLTVYLRLQQIICGYIPEGEGRPMHEIFGSWSENPRICSMLELISDRPEGERAIIWCRFIEDIKRVSEGLRESYGERSVVQFYGDVKDEARNEAVAKFEGERIIMGKSGNVLRKEEVPEKDRAKFMIAQQRAGGLGQTWVAASLSLHYSNTFSLIDRLQAEDRLHRIGQRRVVQYIDEEAENTIDSIIIESMISKKNVADVINGDKSNEWLLPS